MTTAPDMNGMATRAEQQALSDMGFLAQDAVSDVQSPESVQAAQKFALRVDIPESVSVHQAILAVHGALRTDVSDANQVLHNKLNGRFELSGAEQHINIADAFNMRMGLHTGRGGEIPAFRDMINGENNPIPAPMVGDYFFVNKLDTEQRAAYLTATVDNKSHVFYAAPQQETTVAIAPPDGKAISAASRRAELIHGTSMSPAERQHATVDKFNSDPHWVHRMQAQMVLMGYDVGEHGVDGVFGPATEKALRQFAADEGTAGQPVLQTLQEKFGAVVGDISDHELVGTARDSHARRSMGIDAAGVQHAGITRQTVAAYNGDLPAADVQQTPVIDAGRTSRLGQFIDQQMDIRDAHAAKIREGLSGLKDKVSAEIDRRNARFTGTPEEREAARMDDNTRFGRAVNKAEDAMSHATDKVAAEADRRTSRFTGTPEEREAARMDDSTRFGRMVNTAEGVLEKTAEKTADMADKTMTGYKGLASTFIEQGKQASRFLASDAQKPKEPAAENTVDKVETVKVSVKTDVTRDMPKMR